MGGIYGLRFDVLKCTGSVQDALNIWASKIKNLLTSPLIRNVQDNNPAKGDSYELNDTEEFFMAEQTIDSRTPRGDLSLAAIVSIEQFSRKKMQRIFKALVPPNVSDDARNLVEYCCFRFLSRDSSEIHPLLKMRHALILSKNLVVADKTLIEKAAITCRDKHSVVEKTQATIDAAMIEGIPSNIDLIKDIVLPLTVIAKNFGKLRRWEEPHLTSSFLGFVYALIYRYDSR